MEKPISFKRVLGRSGIEISALGLGCWAIGGPSWKQGTPTGWGEVNDESSVQAIHRALDLGVNFFDTADMYGAGHSERVLGRALTRKWEQVILATKFGQEFDEATRQGIGDNHDPAYVRRACEASLRRLGTDHIDLYQLHLKALDQNFVPPLLNALEELVAEGKIRYYGWSTDDPARARIFAEGAHCTAIQFRLNILEDAPEMLSVCREFRLASINRSPLGMGLLTGKFKPDTLIATDDVRKDRPEFTENRAFLLDRLESVRKILTSEGRSLAQGALAWLWARSPNNIPIPGFKSLAQVEENTYAMKFGPLTEEQMQAVATLLSSQPG